MAVVWKRILTTDDLVHDKLTGLTDNDHPQYQLRCGVSARTATLSYSSGVFSATRVTDYDVWTNGVKWTITNTRTVNITNDNTLHYVYFDTDGVMKVATSPWDITGNAAPFALVFRVSASLAAIGDERHVMDRNRALHAMLHETVGARYDSQAGGLTGTFSSPPGFSISTGHIWDEDLEHTITGPKTACRVWYRNTGATAMTFLDNQSTLYHLNGSNLQYDSSGTLQDATVNRYICHYVYGTNDVAYPIYSMIGQAQHTTIASAQNEPTPAFAGLSTVEWKLLYKVIYQNTGSPPSYVSAQDYRTVSGVPTSFTPTAHASLTGLDANDHTQYFLTSNVIDEDNMASDSNTKVPTQQSVKAYVDANVGTGGGGATKDVTQASHGFSVGNIVRHNGTIYVKAQADTWSNAEVIGIVSAVDGNDFTLLTAGPVTGLSGLTAGTVYYLSASSAGALTATEPTISKPLLWTDSTTSGFFYNMRGAEITAGALLELGETSTTAYRGDRGKTAYDHSQAEHNFGLPTYKNLVMSQASNTTVSVTADLVVVMNSTYGTKVLASLSETVDITASGTNGLDTGSESSSTWYHIWAIAKADGTLDCILSASASAPTYPTGYTYKCYLGAVYNNSSGNFVQFTQTDRLVSIPTTASVAGATTAAAWTEANLSAIVPPNAKKIFGDAVILNNHSTADTIQFYVAPSNNSGGCSYNHVSIENGWYWPSLAFVIQLYSNAYARYYWYGVSGANNFSTTQYIRGWEY